MTGKVRPVPALLSPVTALWREFGSLFSVPLAFIGGFLGMLVLCATLVAIAIWAPKLAVAGEDDEFELEFQPGTLVRLGKKLEERELPEKLVVEETRVEAESIPDALTKEDKAKPDPEPKKKKEKEKKAKDKPSDKKKGKASDHEQASNNPWNDLPTVEQLPGDPFGTTDGWSDLLKEGDPWATAVMAALNGMKVGSFAAESKKGRYQFRLKICKDGSVDKVMKKASSGNVELDNAIRTELLNLRVKKPPTQVLKKMKSRCVTLKYTFVWRAGRVD
ncbi:MAG: hypothetical protein V3V08_01075 [Nannocystaceae bacterium]